MTTVANVRSYKGSMDRAVYCGRPGPYGNPFSQGPRQARIDAFRIWFYQPAQAPLRARALQECDGKVLLCWCTPLPCHCDVIAEFVNQHRYSRPSPTVERPDARSES